MEYREFRAEKVGVNDEGKLYGVALPFNRETVIGDLKRGGWREEAAPGLTKKSIQEGDVVFLAHHDMHMPLARMSAGNLDLREDGENLRYEVEPVDTSYGRDIRALAEKRVLGGVSIGFNAVKDEWRDDDGNPSDKFRGTHRILREIKLIEISAVTNPAYKDTSIMARDELLAEREALARETEESDDERAAKATYDDLATCAECGATGQYGAYCSNCGKSMKQSKTSGKYCTTCGAKLDNGNRSDHECEEGARELAIAQAEERAASVSAADRKALAAKGHALPDGSYPIPDKSHLHAAAVLAASGHGDVAAAKALIRKRAKALGVDVSTLPGFGKESKDQDEELPGEGRGQEPEASTPDDEDVFTLLSRHAQAKQRSRDLGLV